MDMLREIFETIGRNKLRTALTGFSVAWGIFILIVLLGAGNGLMHAFADESDKNVRSSMNVSPGWTSRAYDGLNAGRRLRFDGRDLTTMRDDFGERLVDLCPTCGEGSQVVAVGRNYAQVNLEGVTPGYAGMENLELVAGRFIDHIDIEEHRKSLVLNRKTAEVLFGLRRDDPDKRRAAAACQGVLGRFVTSSGVAWKVVGIYQDQQDMGQSEVYCPIGTLQTIFSRGSYIDNFSFTFRGIDDMEGVEDFERAIRQALAPLHRYHPDDNGALWIWNNLRQFLQSQQAVVMLRWAIWIIGFLTLISGIVGVSNIMLITVKERTREFGIRKALGARPRQILSLILCESVVITALFGYIGLVLGIGATELMDNMMGNQVMDTGLWQEQMFKNPTVEMSTAVEATLVLIVCGTLAGFFPAKKAVSIRPIEALRAE